MRCWRSSGGRSGAGQRAQAAGGAECLVEHHDRDPAAVAPCTLQRVGAAERDALRDDRVGRGGLGDLGALDGGRAAHGGELSRLQRRLQPSVDPALGNAAGRDDRTQCVRAVAGGCSQRRLARPRARAERTTGAVARVHSVTTAKAHGSRNLVRIGARRIVAEGRIGDTVAKRTRISETAYTGCARGYRIRDVQGVREERG